MIIPLEELSTEALHGVIENFILREGTDYGHHTYSHEQKFNQVMNQVKNKQAFIVFDPKTESCSVMTRQELFEK